MTKKIIRDYSLNFLIHDAIVYKTQNSNSGQIMVLHQGDSVILPIDVEKEVKNWRTVALYSKQNGALIGKGYIQEEAIFTRRYLKINQELVNIFENPSEESKITNTLKKNWLMIHIGQTNGWLKIYDYEGHEGYIPATTNLKEVNKGYNESSFHFNSSGCLIMLGALAMLLIAIIVSSIGPTLFIGAIIFSLILFFKGGNLFFSGS
jgi:hypothetical protein